MWKLGQAVQVLARDSMTGKVEWHGGYEFVRAYDDNTVAVKRTKEGPGKGHVTTWTHDTVRLERSLAFTSTRELKAEHAQLMSNASKCGIGRIEETRFRPSWKSAGPTGHTNRTATDLTRLWAPRIGRASRGEPDSATNTRRFP